MSISPGFTYLGPVLQGNQFTAEWQRQLDRVLKTAMAEGATWTGTISFGSTGAQSSQDFTVQFKAGQCPQGTTCVLLSSPKPPANSQFSAHVDANDKVVIRFNNYSSGPLSFAAAVFSLVLVSAI